MGLSDWVVLATAIASWSVFSIVSGNYQIILSAYTTSGTESIIIFAFIVQIKLLLYNKLRNVDSNEHT